MGKVMRQGLDLIYRSSCWLAAACIATICLLVLAQVSLNLIDRLSSSLSGEAIGLTIPSYADFTGFLLAAASFLALAHSLRSGAHIRVILLLDRLPARVQWFAEIWCLLFALGIAGYFTWYTGGLVHESYTYNDLSSGMIAVPLWLPQMAMLAGLLIFCLALADELVTVLSGKEASYSEKGEKMLAREPVAREVDVPDDRQEG